MEPRSLKTRFVCISDTHNATPADGNFKLPKGDVLIHAGDLTKQGTLVELRKTLDWIEAAEFKVKLVIAGNHDVTLDNVFYEEFGSHFHNQHPQDSQACIELINRYPSITYLNHEHAKVQFMREDGLQTGFKVFGSPYSPANGLWAFGYPLEKASEMWDKSIPLDTDIVITHTPPKYHCDESRDRGSAGCEILRQKLWRVRPALAICGHVHEGRGAERITWDLEMQNVKYKEFLTGHWIDPVADSKKQCLIDLSSKSQSPLINTIASMRGIDPSTDESFKPDVSALRSSRLWEFRDSATDNRALPLMHDSPNPHVDEPYPAVWGQGGEPLTGRCDLDALAGRLHKRETCCINAAIMASSWPYKSKGNQRFNKPIIVDIDLPVWQREDIDALPNDLGLSERSLGATETTRWDQSTTCLR